MQCCRAYEKSDTVTQCSSFDMQAWSIPHQAMTYSLSMTSGASTSFPTRKHPIVLCILLRSHLTSTIKPNNPNHSSPPITPHPQSLLTLTTNPHKHLNNPLSYKPLSTPSLGTIAQPPLLTHRTTHPLPHECFPRWPPKTSIPPIKLPPSPPPPSFLPNP